MTDRDSLIKGLECALGNYPGDKYCKTCAYQPYRFGRCKKDAQKEALTILREQREIILCKDCSYWRKLLLNQDGHGLCCLDNRVHAPDWFCPKGTRRE